MRRRRALRMTVLMAAVLACGILLGCAAAALRAEPAEGRELSAANDSTSAADDIRSPRRQSEPAETAVPDRNDWRLLLVNAAHPLPADFTVETADVGHGYTFDVRAADHLIEMLSDCEDAGLFPLICSAYRLREKQESLFARQIEKQRAKGQDGDQAVTAASAVVAYPGTSEHETGLAVDICARDYQLLDEGQEETPEYQWLLAHCAEYGFILRYPPDKTHVTGIIYEPWHFRYVGEQAAREIMERGITLEEYLGETE